MEGSGASATVMGAVVVVGGTIAGWLLTGCVTGVTVPFGLGLKVIGVTVGGSTGGSGSTGGAGGGGGAKNLFQSNPGVKALFGRLLEADPKRLVGKVKVGKLVNVLEVGWVNVGCVTTGCVNVDCVKDVGWVKDVETV